MIGAGTAERTVKSIMDRLFIPVLTPPDDQDIQAQLAQAVNDSQTAIALGTFAVPEDEGLIRIGTLLELDQELMRVVNYIPSTQTIAGAAEVTRGEYGTKPVAHEVPLMVVIDPPYARAVVFEAVADNIIQLFPSLSQAKEEMLSPTTSNVYSIGDELAVEVISITPGDFTASVQFDGKIVDFHPMTGGRSLITNSAGGSVWLRYRRRMGNALAETDLLDDLGVDPRWASIVMVGAAADLIVGRDVPAAQTEWVKSVLEAENIRVGSRMSLGGGLRQYHGMLLRAAMKEMKAEYRPRVHMRNAFGQVV